jgi:hypothetical protein
MGERVDKIARGRDDEQEFAYAGSQIVAVAEQLAHYQRLAFEMRLGHHAATLLESGLDPGAGRSIGAERRRPALVQMR